jgi:FemAB-related protein (PEP-CTERM system-associated)
MSHDSRVDVAGIEDAAAWDEYVARQPDATFYHLFGWKLVAERSYGLRAPFVIARDGNGGPIRGVLPLIQVPRPFTSYLTTGLFGAYGRLLADEEHHARALLAAAAARVDSGLVRHLHLKLLGDVPAGLPLQRHDLWVTAKLDLTDDPEALFPRLNRKVRWRLRRADRTGFEPARGPAELDGFYDVLCENMHRKGVPAHGRSFFRSMLRVLSPHVDVLTLRHRDQVVSGALIAAFHGTLYAPFSSSRMEFFKSGVNVRLWWEIIRAAYELGCRTIDFGSSLRDSTGLEFKLQWRPRVEPIATYTYAPGGETPKLLAEESFIVSRFVDVWQRFPSGLARAFGPALCRWIV